MNVSRSLIYTWDQHNQKHIHAHYMTKECAISIYFCQKLLKCLISQLSNISTASTSDEISINNEN